MLIVVCQIMVLLMYHYNPHCILLAIQYFLKNLYFSTLSGTFPLHFYFTVGPTDDVAS